MLVGEVNALIARLHNGRQVHYLDISPVFLGIDGRITTDVMYDHLHLTEEGYRRWEQALRPKFREFDM